MLSFRIIKTLFFIVIIPSLAFTSSSKQRNLKRAIVKECKKLDYEPAATFITQYDCDAESAVAGSKLTRLVEQIAKKAGLPVPELFVLRNTTTYKNHATTASSASADASPEEILDSIMILIDFDFIKNLSLPELKGHIAHELAHVKNFHLQRLIKMDAWAKKIRIFALAGNFLISLCNTRWLSGTASILLGSASTLGIAGLFVLYDTVITNMIRRGQELEADCDAAKILNNPKMVIKGLKKMEKLSPQPYQQVPIKSPLDLVSNLCNKINHLIEGSHPFTNERITALKNLKSLLDKQQLSQKNGISPTTDQANDTSNKRCERDKPIDEQKT